VQLWIQTKDPEFSGSNPKKGVLESRAELVRATIECNYILPDVRVPSIPFGSKKMNSKISESLTVYVS
jgi:hypothetical protein